MQKLLSSRANSFVLQRLRLLTFVGSWLVATGYGAVARAETAPTRECIDAHANGQVARGQGGLLQARSFFQSCAVEICPQVIRDDCAKFAAEVEALLPTVVVVARSTSGQALAAATVKIDGSAQALPIDGRAVFLDPGQHVFMVATRDGSEASVTTLIRESEKDRRVIVQVAPRAPRPSDAPSAEERRKISPLVPVFGAAGLLSAASFTYFALDGRSRENTLKECAPACNPSEVSKMHRSYLAADVSLGVAIASLGLGVYFLLQPSATTPSRSIAMSSLSLSTSPDLSAVRLSASAAF